MFELVAGSVRGRDHSLAGKNNQDSWYIEKDDDTIVAVVCDGCGDPRNPHSEVGAYIGARIVADNVLFASYGMHPSDRDVWDMARYRSVCDIENIADRISGAHLKDTLLDSFLFTIIGILIKPSSTVVFTIGDGVAYINCDGGSLPTYPNNAPPYISYNLISNSSSFNFNIRSIISTSRLNSFLIASDGASDLIASEEVIRSGKPVGPIAQFWTDDVYYTDSNAVNRRLAAINRESQVIDWEAREVRKIAGPLRDDTTIIAGRRIKD